MKSVSVQITPGGRASRAEVIIRIFYGLVAGIILSIFLWVVGILVFVNFFSCLILAKRVGVGFIAKVIEQIPKLYAYTYFVTDERPPIVPEF